MSAEANLLERRQTRPPGERPMRITCKKCGTELELPDGTQPDDVVRCGNCGKGIRVKLRPSRKRVAAPIGEDAPEPKRRGGRGVMAIVALLVLGGVGYALFQNQGLDVDAVKQLVQDKLPGNNADADVTGAGDDALATQVAALFEERCHSCHGEGGSDEGGFNFVLRLDKLTEDDAYVTANDPENSYLFSRIEDAEMPPPGEGEPFNDAEIEMVRAWIEAGAAPIGGEVEGPEPVSNDELLLAMREDLQSVDEADRRNTRYFTLTHLYNAGFSQDEMETYRLAMSKLLNSLSWQPDLVVPERIGEEETLLRINLSDLGWDTNTWDAIVDTDPYATVVGTPDGLAIRDLTGTDVPNVRADWFVSRASRAPLYYEILEIPAQFDDLLTRPEVQVDVDRNIAGDQVVRAAFVESGVSDNNRMIERHAFQHGGFWVSYDFASSTDQQNVVEHPLGPDGNDAFDHDGGEIIWNLPNGMQAYMLIDGEGNRIDKGPLNIVADDKQSDRAVVCGLSCMSCHANGMIRKQDEVRPTVLANREAYPQADRILQQYPESDVINDVFDEDTERFEGALKDLGFDRLTDTSEPVYHMAKRFEQAVDRSLAAAEFGVSEEQFVSLLDETPKVARVLGPLKLPNGKVKRKQFLAEFKAAAKAFGFGEAFGVSPTDAVPEINVADAGNAASANAGVPTPPSDADPQPGTGAEPKGPPADLPPAELASVADPNLPTTPTITEAIPVKEPPELVHQWVNKNGDPMLNGYFLQITRTGDVQIGVVDRDWSIETSDGDTREFIGSFMSFYKDPGQPTMVRIEADLGQTLNYVDFPIDVFSEGDRVYLANLEDHVRYANFYKHRLRSFTLPWDVISPADQRYVYEVVAAIQQGLFGPPQAAATEPPVGEVPPAGPPQQPVKGPDVARTPPPAVAADAPPAGQPPAKAPEPQTPSLPVVQPPPQEDDGPIEEPPPPATAPVPPSFDY